MAESLGEQMNLSVDQKKLTYYESLIFEDYKLDLNGNRGVLTLIPANKTAPVEYLFALKKYDMKEAIVVSDWQDSNSYFFLLPDFGDYYIEVTIKSRDDDYQMAVNFRIYYQE